jgi:mono/diheme cytochrome c family protein
MIKQGAIAIAAAGLVGAVLYGQARVPSPAPAPEAAAVARGEYLTWHVGMCVQCHTPRDQNGNLIETKAFTGAPVPLTTPWPHRPWAFAAPRIAGLGGFTEEQILTLLTTGQAVGREKPKPPMPPFRLSQDDARAVVAYLKTLPSER